MRGNSWKRRGFAIFLSFCLFSGTVFGAEPQTEFDGITPAELVTEVASETVEADTDITVEEVTVESDDGGGAPEQETVTEPATDASAPTEAVTEVPTEGQTEAIIVDDVAESETEGLTEGDILIEDETEEQILGEEPEDDILIMSVDEPVGIALDGPVSDSEGNFYESIAAAIAAGKTELTLEDDWTESISLSGQTLSLNLGGHTLTAKDNAVITLNGGNVTVTNGTLDGAGAYRCVSGKNACTFTGEQLAVQNGYIKNSKGGGLYFTGGNTVTLTDAEICNNQSVGMSTGGAGLALTSTQFSGGAATFTGERLEIHDNGSTETSSGGGVSFTMVMGSMSDSQVYGNTAVNGGGITVAGMATDTPFMFNDVNITGNTATGDGAAIYASGIAKYEFHGGTVSGHVAGNPKSIVCLVDDNATLQGVTISGNTGMQDTVRVGGSDMIEDCRIEDNKATHIGGLYLSGSMKSPVIRNTVITDNESSDVWSSNIPPNNASGGLSVAKLTRCNVTLEGGAIYNNRLAEGNPTKANDVYIEAGNDFTLFTASGMTDAGKDFTYYKWETADGMVYDSEMAAGTQWCLTAFEDKPRFVASVDGVKYESLQDAINAADHGQYVMIIAGEDPSDELGKTMTIEPITIDKIVKLWFHDQVISSTSDDPIFHVTGEGRLDLVGYGMINGKVESEGRLSLSGTVMAEEYIHHGSEFSVGIYIPEMTVSLGEKPIVFEEDYTGIDYPDSLTIRLDPEFVEQFNDESQTTPDKILIEGDDTFDLSTLTVEGINPLIAQIVCEDGKVILRKSVLQGVFIGGENGDDSNDGLSTGKPVASFTRAQQILDGHPEFDTIWVIGQVDVSDAQVLDKKGITVQRHTSYGGVMIHVAEGGTLELHNITVDGSAQYIGHATETMISCAVGSEIHINRGAVLRDNSVCDGGTMTLGDRDHAEGGAIKSDGSVKLNGGTIEDCQAYYGGGIFIGGVHGKLTISDGTIRNCKAVGRVRSEVGGSIGFAFACGGGIGLEMDAQITMTGGVIEGCESEGIGGGISLGEEFLMFDHSGSTEESFVLSGGTIQDCTAHGNGGGVYVQGSYRMLMTGGTITGCDSLSGSFGGGGIYVNNGRGSEPNGRLELENAAIYKNTSKMYGGGLAGCSTSDTEIYLNSGAVFYENEGSDGSDDIYLSNADGYGNTGSAPDSFVSEYMLGGAPYFWKHTNNGQDYGVNYLHPDDLVKHMYTEATAADEGVQAAMGLAQAYIYGNTAEMHGGGIGSNGDVIIGSADPDVVDIRVKKEWDDENYEKRRPEKVLVWLVQDGEKVVCCVEIDVDEYGNWPEVVFSDQPSGHTYNVYEQTSSGSIYTSTVEPAEDNAELYTITNHVNCGDLEIYKVASGVPDGLDTGRFTFDIEVTKEDGTPLDGTYATYDLNAETGEITFTEGKASVELWPDEVIFIKDIPENADFTVTERNTEGWIVYAGSIPAIVEQDTVSGTIEARLVSEVQFKNVWCRDLTLTVEKTLMSDGKVYDYDGTFYVSLYADEDLTDLVDGPIGFDVENGIGDVTFEGLWNHRAYYAAETDSDGNVLEDGVTCYLPDGSTFVPVFEDGHEVAMDHNAEQKLSFVNEVTSKEAVPYGELQFSKTLTGREAIAGKDVYMFTISGVDGAPMPEHDSASIDLSEKDGGTFDDLFGGIPFTEAGTYRYDICESDGGLGGITYDKTWYRVEITVDAFTTIYGEDVLLPYVTAVQVSSDGRTYTDYDEESMQFANSYAAAPVTYAPKVSKAIEGSPVPVGTDKTFTFTIAANDDYDGVTMPDVTEVSVTGEGDASFGGITFMKTGTYQFTITETEGLEPGYTYDDTVYTLTVEVTDDTDGHLVAAGTYQAEGSEETSEDAAVFANIYAVTSVTYAPSVTKVLTGEPTPEDKDFTFTIDLSEGDAEGCTFGRKSATVTGAGSGAFDAITFTKAGTYSFMIAETDGGEHGYTYSDAKWTLMVTVEDHDSVLVVTGHTYQEEDSTDLSTAGATFTNAYAVEPTSYILSVEKQLTGDAAPSAKPFSFTLSYRSGHRDGYVMAGHTATVNGEGTATFGRITFTKAGTYVFAVQETDGKLPGYTYSDDVWLVTIPVTDEDDYLTVGDVTFTLDGDAADAVTFMNEYHVSPVTFAPKAKKTVSGNVVPAGQEKTFDFAIAPVEAYDGVTMSEDTSASVKGEGEAIFGDITFTKAGTYSFTINEVAVGDAGYSYDGSVYNLEVKVADDWDSHLVVTEVNYVKQSTGETFEGYAPFTNTYTVKPVTYAPKVKKVIAGSEAPDAKAFLFTLNVNEGNPAGCTVSGTDLEIDGAGEGTFGDLTFTKAGTYQFTIRETAGSEHGYTYDSSEHTLTVTVTDNASQLEVSSAVYENEGEEEPEATFTNVYAVEGTTYAFLVEKRLTGDVTPSDAVFRFRIDGEEKDGYAIANHTMRLSGAGKGAFDPVSFTAAGTYTFTVSEVKGSAAGYTYDDTVYTVTVTVVDDDDLLEVQSVVYSAGDVETDGLVFTNEYHVSPVLYAPQVHKVVSGVTPVKDAVFSFRLRAEEQDGMVLPKQTLLDLTGRGMAKFDPVEFTKAGTYKLSISEVNGGLKAYSYSGDVWDVTVKVVDNGSLLTVSEVTYSCKDKTDETAAEFVNKHLIGDLVVTKTLTFDGYEICSDDAVFYVALYSDETCKRRVSDVKMLAFVNAGQAEAVFDGLEVGTAYYISECDAEGNAVGAGGMDDGIRYSVLYPEGQSVILSTAGEQARRKFENAFQSFPSHYYYEGYLTITKNLEGRDGSPMASNDTFYIGVFADPQHTTLASDVTPNIAAVAMDGKSSATVEVHTQAPGQSGTTFYLAETDASGHVLEGTEGFLYDVRMTDLDPTITLQESSATVAVINREKVVEEESETEWTTDGEEEEEDAVVPGDAGGGSPPAGSTSVRTGDETPVGRLLLWMGLSVIVILGCVIQYWRRKRK